MAERKRIDEPTGTETVGHEWDGIEELDNAAAALVAVDVLRHHRLGRRLYGPLSRLADDQQRDRGHCWAGPSRGQLAAEMKAEADRKRPVELALAQIPIERLPERSAS